MKILPSCLSLNSTLPPTQIPISPHLKPSKFFPKQIFSKYQNKPAIILRSTMVAATTMGWLSQFGTRFGDNLKRTKIIDTTKRNNNLLGILAFETAKTMARLVAIYKSLCDQEIHKLKNEVMKSQGVAYLNSSDQNFLLSLACAERLEDLDRIAVAVAWLGQKCSDYGLNRFDHVYTNLKLGTIDLEKLEYGSREINKRIEKIDRLIYATTSLYTSLESLTELEISERKLEQWKKNSVAMQTQKMNFHLFDQKIANQRKQVRYFREMSLWSKTFDKSVGQMARIICIVYARICSVFGPHIAALPRVSLRSVLFSPKQEVIKVQPEFCLAEPIKEKVCSKSGPVPSTSKPGLVRFYSPKSIIDSDYGTAKGASKNNRVFHAAGPSTIGGSGLALRYANVILLAERYLDSPTIIGRDELENLYEMLPENLKFSVRSKLRKNVKGPDMDESLAEGWREALESMMGWLAPMAHDTVRWQLEKNYEKNKLESKPPVLLLQTLHFSDKEKTEAAIAEVLVGLSCICRFGNRGSGWGRRWG